MHQRLRVMGLTVLAVAASAVLLGGSSASHAELAGGPALTQNSDPVGLMACNLLAIQILENFDTRLDVSATGKRVLKDKPALVIVNSNGLWLWRSGTGLQLRSEMGEPSDHAYLRDIERERPEFDNAFKHQCKKSGKATRS